MNLPMRCFTIGGVVAVLAAALVAGLTLTRGVAGPRQKAAGYVDEIVAMHALQADIGLLRAQRQKLTETAVTGPSIKSLVGTVLVDASEQGDLADDNAWGVAFRRTPQTPPTEWSR